MCCVTGRGDENEGTEVTRRVTDALDPEEWMSEMKENKDGWM